MKNEQQPKETAYEKLHRLAILLVITVVISFAALVLLVKYGVNIPTVPIIIIVLGYTLWWGPRKNEGLIVIIVGIVGLVGHLLIDIF